MSLEDVAGRLADIPHQPQASEQLDEVITDVDPPPEKALVGRALIAVVVVVPAFAESDKGHPYVVAALVGSGVAAAAEKMTYRVHHEDRMVQENRADEKAPNETSPAADQKAQRRHCQAWKPMLPVQPDQLRLPAPVTDEQPLR